MTNVKSGIGAAASIKLQMVLLRPLLWLTAAILGLASWLTGEQWLGELWYIAMAFLAVTLLAISVWIAVDWPHRSGSQQG